MCSSLLYALYIISINQWKNPGMSNIKFTFYILVFGLLTMFVYSFIAGESILMLQTPKQWLCAAQLALLPTVLSLFFMTVSINLIGSTPAAIMGLGAGNSRHHRRMRLRREFLSAAGDRHPRYPGWRNDYHRKKERVKG